MNIFESVVRHNWLSAKWIFVKTDGQTESDKYEPTVQYAQVDSEKTFRVKKNLVCTTLPPPIINGWPLRDRSLIMAWRVGKLEGGTELFGVLGWGEPEFCVVQEVDKWARGQLTPCPFRVASFFHTQGLGQIRPCTWHLSRTGVYSLSTCKRGPKGLFHLRSWGGGARPSVLFSSLTLFSLGIVH